MILATECADSRLTEGVPDPLQVLGGERRTKTSRIKEIKVERIVVFHRSVLADAEIDVAIFGPKLIVAGNDVHKQCRSLAKGIGWLRSQIGCRRKSGSTRAIGFVGELPDRVT